MQRTRSTSAPSSHDRDAPVDTAGFGGPRFSVVIPAYDEGRFIGACLRALCEQDFNGSYVVVEGRRSWW